MKKIFLLVFPLLSFVNGWAATTTPSLDKNSELYYIIDNDGNATITNADNLQKTQNSYSNFTSIVIPSEITDETGTYKVTSIGVSAFYGCTSLLSVVIPESVISIGNYAFQGCTYLILLSIPKSVTSIGSSAFYECTSLTSIVIPESVTSIESGTFYGCTSLTSVVIPENVTNINAQAFYNCSKLTAVYFKSKSSPTISTGSTGAFVNGPSDGRCYYVPYGCTASYTSLSPLAEFYFDDDFFYQLDEDNDLTIIYTTISTTAKSITIPNTFTVVDETATTYTVASIESGLFANFTSLTEVFVNWKTPVMIGEGLFSEEIIGNATLYVPEGIVEEYKKEEYGWTKYFSTIEVYVEEEEQGEGSGTGEGDDDNQDLEESTNYTVIDGIKYEIIDDDVVQIVGTTAENIVFVTEVEIEESTYDVESIVADAFVDYTDLSASVTFIDPEKIVVEGDSYSEKVGTLTVPDGCVDMYNRSDWTKIFTISGNDYLVINDVYYIFKSSSLKSSSASKKITLEVDHIDANATSVTIPEDIYLDNYGYFNVTSINSTAFENCDAIETLTIEADIPVTDAEALTTLPDNCILIVADLYEGKYDELLASTNITIITKSESVTNIKNVSTEKVEVARYNILGQQLSAPFLGINLIKYSDGTVEKVIVK